MYANPATSIVCYPYLPVEACEALLDDLGAESWKPGRIARPGRDGADEGEIRRCGISEDIDPELLERLDRDLLSLNEQVYQFAIEGFLESDPVTVMRYEPGDHFVWHIDNGADAAPFRSRKLSFSIQLSDPGAYDGGELEFAMYTQAYGGELFEAQRSATRQRGALVVFPSFHLHRVSPVTRGVRAALVGWLHGPSFR